MEVGKSRRAEERGSNVVDRMKVDYDSPWKEVLEAYFPEFLVFFFPAVYDGIDWSRPYGFLEKEKKMRYVTSIERQGMEKGMLQKSREAVLDILEARFGNVPQTMKQAISASKDISLLKVLLKKAALVVALEEFEKIREKRLPL